MKPTVERIVHYVMTGGKHRAAIVVETPEHMTDITLTVERTWHWPEREG